MAEHYNANGITVTDEAIVINGSNRPLDRILAAEATQVQDFARNLVFFIVGCAAPILALVAFTQMGLIYSLRENIHHMAFGTLILLTVVACGVITGLIGIAWKKPWGVLIEIKDHGHEKLTKTASQEEAEKLAGALNKAVGNE